MILFKLWTMLNRINIFTCENVNNTNQYKTCMRWDELYLNNIFQHQRSTFPSASLYKSNVKFSYFDFVDQKFTYLQHHINYQTIIFINKTENFKNRANLLIITNLYWSISTWIVNSNETRYIINIDKEN